MRNTSRTANVQPMRCMNVGWFCGFAIPGIRRISGSNLDRTSNMLNNPLFWFRTIFASQRGTLMELGTGPMMFTGLLMQLLSGFNILNVNPRDRKQAALMSGFQKLVTICMTLLQAVLHIALGMYGPVRAMGAFRALAILVQLSGMSVIVMLLDELCQKGYGIASGVSLLTATNVCENIIWKSFSIATVDRGNGKEVEGAIFALFHLLVVRSNKLSALFEAFTREGLPNLFNIIFTLAILLVVIFLQGVVYYVPLQHEATRQPMNFPIKLLYTSNTPVMFQSAMTSYLFMISQFIFKRWGGNFFVRLLGSWREVEYRPGQFYPTGGLIYFLAAPSSLKNALLHPIHTVLYIVYKCVTCALFARMWVRYSNSSPAKVSDDIRRNRLIKPGVRPEKIGRFIRNPIMIAATLGGGIVGLISVLADIFGAIGSGTGILLAASTISEVCQKVMEEFIQ
eukprot:gnl/Chilomastix_cuspidata/326.p1 GENE.gnl/Chilomastix_cuspidata/326~~gnl/Chilomastix_cuspidata/326.p1  ORF type:complete len:453 (+),score=216.03 gnl/Chilomastix_cuspidata/326:72-1430(+)